MIEPRRSEDQERRGLSAIESDTTSAAQALADVVRQEWSQVVATLTRVTGDLSLAEDAAQDAALEAMQSWRQQLPSRPGAWILTVARRRAVDRIRREATGRRKTELLGRLEAWDQQHIDDPADQIGVLETSLRDDQLRLIFGCCHPALNIEAQTALTLRSVGGLTTDQIAAAFLVPSATMGQRIVRAKRKIASANIPFTLPPDAELLDRLASVHRIVYLIFNEGYAASGGDEHVRPDLCAEALRLARLLVELVPDDAETFGLTALMLATHARASTRVDAAGVPVLLEDQERSQWDRDLINEAEHVLDTALRLPGSAGPYTVQAAIAVLHAQPQASADTDWPQIEMLYRKLAELQPGPVVALNHAVAIAMAHGAEAGLAKLDSPDLTAALADYRYFHSARADLLARLGCSAKSIEAYNQAIALTATAPEAALLRRKRDALP